MSWAEVDRLIDEQQFQAALELVTGIRERAQQAGDEAEWTRALVRETQLQTGLHGLRDLGPAPAGDALAGAAALPRGAGSVLRAQPGRLSRRLRLGDRRPRAGRERRRGRSAGLDPRADRRRGRRRLRPDLGRARGLGRRGAGRAGGVLRRQRLSAADPRHAARRGHLPVGRLAGGQLAVERRPRRTASTGWIWRRCSRSRPRDLPAPPPGTRWSELVRAAGRPRGLASGPRAARGRLRGPARAAAPAVGGVRPRRRPGADPRVARTGARRAGPRASSGGPLARRCWPPGSARRTRRTAWCGRARSPGRAPPAIPTRSVAGAAAT